MRPGQPFIGRHSPLTRGADRQTPDSTLAPPEGPLPVSYCGGSPPPPPEGARTEALTLTAWYVDPHTELGRTKPTARLVGQEATEITDQPRLGATPDTVKSAIRVQVEEG